MRTSLSRKRAYQKGLWGERVARVFLQAKGYRFLAHRLKTPFGEIDLLFRRGNTLVVVEVKVRPTLMAGFEAVPSFTINRLKNAVSFFLTHKPEYAYLNIRFDLIILRPWRLPQHFPHVLFFNS